MPLRRTRTCSCGRAGLSRQLLHWKERMQNPFQRFRSSRSAQSSTTFHDNTTGFNGWRIVLEPGRGVPTPAVGRGRLFVGGGFGSYDYFAFDAATGARAWHLRTTDDGPTAAVLTDGFVVF